MSDNNGIDDDHFNEFAEGRRQVIEESKNRQERIERANESQIADKSLISIERSEVAYYMHPKILPWSHINLEKFIDAIEKKFKISCNLRKDLTDEMLNNFLNGVRSGKELLRFFDGLFDLKDAPSIPISALSISSQSVQVTVLGLSEIAEAVAQETVELFWEMIGEPRAWSSLSSDLGLKQFGTETRNRIGMPLTKFLSTGLCAFIDQQVVNEGGYAAAMRATGSDYSQDKNSDIRGGVVIDGITLRVNTFNLNTGESDSNTLSFDVRRKNDYGTDIVHITSVLPFEKHMEMVRSLLNYLRV